MKPILETLRAVNEEINKIPYQSQVGDDWNPYTDNGFDCSNYATRKMERLAAEGVPKTSMRLATAWTDESKNEYHSVLLVDHEGQTYVLDNRHALPIEHQLLPYKWHKLQKAGTRDWESAF